MLETETNYYFVQEKVDVFFKHAEMWHRAVQARCVATSIEETCGRFGQITMKNGILVRLCSGRVESQFYETLFNERIRIPPPVGRTTVG